jgi:coenzyme PQQ precursor peptide PqqA
MHVLRAGGRSLCDDRTGWNQHATRAFSIECPEERRMKWKKPRIVEIAVGLEINSYACAELG